MPDSVQVVDLPPGWTRHVAPTGHYYYYNKESGVSTYDKPIAPVKSKKRPRRSFKDGPKFKVDLAVKPWVLVICKSGKRFVHNTETKESLWTGPEDVQKEVESQDRDMMIGLIAKARGLTLDEPQRSEGQHQKPIDHKEPPESETVPGPDTKAEPEPESESEEEEEEEETVVNQSESDDEDEQVVEFESGDDDEEEELNEEEKKQQFWAMLDEFKINAFGTWDTERDKVINDDRYDVYDSNKERREQFEEWAAKRLAEQPKARVKSDPSEEFLKFVADKYNPKKHQFYLDFKRKMRKEPEFANSKLSDKEKEGLFRQHVNARKKG